MGAQGLHHRVHAVHVALLSPTLLPTSLAALGRPLACHD
jgi:hypothetical protein